MTNDAGRRQERREALFRSTQDGECCAACRMARGKYCADTAIGQALVPTHDRQFLGPAILRRAQRLISRPAGFTSDTPHNEIQASSGLSESSPKNADVPKSPLHTVAALVPSAGTITLHIELRSDAGVVSIRSGACPRSARRASVA